MFVKTIINIIFLLTITVTSLPVKQARTFFFKTDVPEEMQEGYCDAPVKKMDDALGFKDFPCCNHYIVTICPVSQPLSVYISHADWQLPLWPAVEVHTPPP